MNEENNEDQDPIEKALGLEPIEKTVAVIDNMLSKSHDDSAKNDFEYARANLYEMISEGREAMFKLGQIADSSQHPRSFEVYAKLMDSLIAANQKLLDLQSKIREININDAPINDKAKTINNNLFVGSTAELSKVLQDMKKSGDI